jgi:hypothetical protein
MEGGMPGKRFPMTELSDQFRLDLPVEDAYWVCREAVLYLDWPLLEVIEARRLVLKKGLRFATGFLSQIEVLLSEDGPDATTVKLNGKFPAGVGRTDERTSRSLMNSVRNAMEVQARRSLKQASAMEVLARRSPRQASEASRPNF